MVGISISIRSPIIDPIARCISGYCISCHHDFGATKSRFWNAGHFVNGVFVIQRDGPLASVTVESLLVRTVRQWVQYLARHELTVFQIWDALSDDVVDFATLDSTVHPKYGVLFPALITFVNYCSDAYRTTSNIEFMLQRHTSSLASAPLNLTTVDANNLLFTYFPGQYDVDDFQATDGLFLLRRAFFCISVSDGLRSATNVGSICWLACICLWTLIWPTSPLRTKFAGWFLCFHRRSPIIGCAELIHLCSNNRVIFCENS